MLETYLAALKTAKWNRDEFEKFMGLVEINGDGVSGDAKLDWKMDSTNYDAWKSLLVAHAAFQKTN